MATGFKLMAVRATLRTVGHLSPGTAARWAEELFFRPRKAPSRPVLAQDQMRENIERRFGMRFDDLYIPTLASALRTPVLIIHDRGDEDIPVAEGRAIAAAWPGAELVETTGLGHHVIMRNEAVAERVARFVAG